MSENILVINPGSTSTKVALYREEKLFAEATIRHSVEELATFQSIPDQFEFRKQCIEKFLIDQQIEPSILTAIVARGGLLRAIKGGTYEVNPSMLDDLQAERYGSHASNLGAVLAEALAKPNGIPAYIVDPVVTDELADIARISGLYGIDRRSVGHALNQKAVARKVLAVRGEVYEKSHLIVAHLGGGISISAHQKGQMIDMLNGLDGEGPFSPERTGSLPLIEFSQKIINKQLTLNEVKTLIAGNGGLKSYLGETDLREIETCIKNGDDEAKAVVDAMCYQIAKGIGEMTIPLKGKVDVIILTGGIAYSDYVTKKIKEFTEWIADVEIFPGEHEMIALYRGAKRVLDGVSQAKVY